MRFAKTKKAPFTFGAVVPWFFVACSNSGDPATTDSSTAGAAMSSVGASAAGGSTSDAGSMNSGMMAATAGTPDSGSPAAGGTAPGGNAGDDSGAVAGVGPAGSGGGGAPLGGSSGSGGETAAGGSVSSAGASMGATDSGGEAGDSGAGGFGGAMPSGGAAGGGGEGSTDERASCPDGPFPTPMVMSTQNVCQNFDFDYSWNEGPTWVGSQNAFFFTNFVVRSGSGGHIMKYTPGGDCEIFMRDVGCNGLAVSNDGNLLAACQQSRSVVRIDLETKEMSTVADSYEGEMLDTPNDLIQHSNGTIYFTNPTNELDGRPVGVGPAVFRIDPSGTLSMIREGNCNGIGLSPDETTLYVLLSGLWDLDEQGVPSNRQEMFTTGDGMAVDCAGNVYANGNIFSPDGQNIGSWGSGTNLAFGGQDGQTLLVVASGQVRELTMNVPGLP